MSGAQPGRRWMCQSLGFVVCTSVTCVGNVAAVVAGYCSLRVGANGKARCGTEPSWAQLLLFMLRGREAGVRSDCGALKVSWGLVSTASLTGAWDSPKPSCRGCCPSQTHSPVPVPSRGFRLVCASMPALIPSRSTLIPPCSALQTWQSSDLPSSFPS